MTFESKVDCERINLPALNGTRARLLIVALRGTMVFQSVRRFDGKSFDPDFHILSDASIIERALLKLSEGSSFSGRVNKEELE